MSKFLGPIKGEEWIEKFRHSEFWIARKHVYPEKLYSRLTKSYVGWWCYFRIHSIWATAALLIDPLSCGGLWSHIRCFVFNAVVVQAWWCLKHKVWKLFHKQQWEAQCRFMRAAIMASDEGCAGPMPPPPGFEGINFHGSILGERYFRRIAEIMRDEED